MMPMMLACFACYNLLHTCAPLAFQQPACRNSKYPKHDAVLIMMFACGLGGGCMASTINVITSRFDSACRRYTSIISIIATRFRRESRRESQRYQHRFPSVFQNGQRASSASSPPLSRWQLARKASVVIAFLIAGYLETSGDDADDALRPFRETEGRRS